MPRRQIKHGDIYISKNFNESFFHADLVFVLRPAYCMRGRSDVALVMTGTEPCDLGIFIEHKTLQNDFIFVGNLDD